MSTMIYILAALSCYSLGFLGGILWMGLTRQAMSDDVLEDVLRDDDDVEVPTPEEFEEWMLRH